MRSKNSTCKLLLNVLIKINFRGVNGEDMSYLVCESCGKHYELEEGISSFSHEKCECGGRLRYSDGMVLNSNNSPSVNRSNSECPNCGSINPNNPPVCAVCGTKLRDMPVKNRSPNKISILGVGAGLGFLMISAIFDVLVIFGKNIPQQANNIPHNLLIEFGALFLCLTIFSGLISSYISSNTSYNNGLIKGSCWDYIRISIGGNKRKCSVHLHDDAFGFFLSNWGTFRHIFI